MKLDTTGFYRAKTVGLTHKSVSFLDENTVITVCGNEFKLINVNVGVERTIQGRGLAISCYAIDRVNRRIAYAEKGNAPRIFIISSENGQLLTEISGRLCC